MDPVKVVKRLKMAKKPELQLEIIKDAWENCDEFWTGLQMSCDKTTSIPLEKIVAIETDDGNASEFSFQEFVNLYDQITQVGADPVEAKALVIDAAMRCEFNEWNMFYRKILQKRLQDDLPMELIGQELSKLTGIPIVL